MRRFAAVLAVAALAAAAVPAVAAGATIVVNSSGDAADADPADGRCDTGAPTADGAPECTLRAAIAHANALAGEDTVVFAVPAWMPGGPGPTGETRLIPASPYPSIDDPLVVDGSGDPATPSLVPHRLVLDGSLLAGTTGLVATAPSRLRSTTLEGLALAGDILVETPPTAPEPPDTEPAPDPAPAPDPGTTPVPPTAPDPATPDPRVPQQPEPDPVPVPPTAPEPAAAPGPLVALGPLGIAVVVNSTRDLPDADPGDGVCSTGEAVTVAEAECTFRAALMEADASPLVDTVGFAIPDSDIGRDDDPWRHWVIRPGAPLPEITTTVTVDGTTQPGGTCATAERAPSPAIRIDASGAGAAGLRVTGGSLTLRGVAIGGSPVAVELDAPARGAVLTCDLLGTDPAGTAPSEGLEAAVRIAGSEDATIGGTAPEDGNVLGVGSVAAVRVTGAAAVDDTVLGNRFAGPGRLVDLGRAGDQANDRGDGDTGPNGLLNHPEITSATVHGDTLTVTARVDAAAGQYRVELLGVSDPGTPDATVVPLSTERLLTTGGVVPLTATFDGPAPDGIVATLTAEEGGAPGPGSTSEASPMVTPLATQVISGSVMEDVDGDGQVADDGAGVAGVDVWVFADQGNGVPDAGDPVSRTTRTDGVGNWSVTVPGDGTYWAAVDSRDITPAAGLRGGYTWEDVWAEQTYASAGAVRDAGGGSFTFTGSAGAFYGGARPDRGDGFPVLSSAEHVQRAVVAGADVTGLVTGFSFNAVTNTGDDPAAGGFATAGSWQDFDADGAGIGVNPEGYEHQVFDGRYVYFVPSQRSGGRHGEVLRYDTTGAFTDVGSWASFDAGDNGIGSDPDGYIGAVFDGRYVYFAPDDNGTARHGEVLRLDTQGDFQDAGSWDAYDPGDDGVGVDPDGYRGMTWDGRYVYLAPFNNGTGPSGEVLRYDTHAAFGAPGGWTTFDPSANGVGTDPRGFFDVFFDGRYLYFAPMSNGGGNDGEVLRYDTTASFTAAGSWTTFDPGANGVGADPDGYAAIAGDGRYLYLAPYFNGGAYSGEVLRYDTQAAFAAAGSWTVFDPSTAGLGANAVGYRTATFDGRFLYLAQDKDASGAPAGNVLRYDTRAAFGAAGSWDLYDPGAAGVGTDPDGALGASFDGRYLYVSHWYNGTDFSSEVLRYDTARTGQGSLRRFMRNANAIAGTQSSVFAIPTSDGGYAASPLGFTVTPGAALPTLVDPLTLDASTQSQAGAQGRPVVAVDGSSAGAANGITLGAGSGGSTVRGLAVHSFAWDGVRVLTDGDTVAGNRVGIGFDGTTARPNTGDGIHVTGSNTQVGGTGVTDGNVVSGNGGDGVVLAGGASNTVARNRIGTNAAGTAAVANAGDGVRVNGSSAAVVGGSGAGEGNVISGNGDDGVSLETGSGGAKVLGNAIGVGSSGAVVANGDLGVWVASNGNAVGGTTAGSANTISGNTRAGVLVNGGATGNAILRNAMAGNGGLGIDRNATVITSSAASDGVTANDPGDADGILNTPDITSVVEHTVNATVTYDLDVPAGTYRVEFFANPAGADPSGSGEAEVFRTAATVVHPGGTATYTQTMAAAAGEVITATATEDTGGGFGQTSEISQAVTAVAGNDPPVNTVPASQTIAEDAPLVFTAGGPLELSVADPDAGAGAMDVTLTATNGTLTLSGTAGLTFSTGDGTADAAMRFTGTLAAVNAAFNGAQFIPTLGYAGPASLQIATDDQGNTGVGGPLTDTDTLAITVNAQNDPPLHTMPPAQTVAEDTPLILGGASAIQVADPDAGGAAVRVTLTGGNGLLTLSGVAGLTFTTGDGVIDPLMTFTGTLTDVNAALDGLTFSPAGDHVGAASIRIVTDDQGNTGAGGPLTDDDTLLITVTAVNDPPAIALPAPVTAPGGTPLVLSVAGGDAITIADPDIGTSPARVTLAATHGSLTLSSTANLAFVAGDGSLDTTMTFTGSMVDVLAALDGLTFLPTPGYSGAASIQVDVSDQGATGAGGPLTDTDTLAITLTPNPSAPALDPIPAKTVPEGSTLSFTATATDPDLPGDTLTWSMIGAPAGAAIDASTGAFTWTPTEQQGPGTYTFAVVVTDAGLASDSEPVQVDVTEVNAAPLVDPVADQSSGEGDPVSLQVTATDPDVPAQALTWSATGLPPGLSMDASTGAITGTLATGAAAGSPYAVTVTVTDPDGASGQVTFAWSVALSNSAPVLQPLPDAAVDEQDPFTATASATDAEAQAITFSLRQAPAGMTIDPATGVIRWTPTEAQGPGTFTVKVAATDAGVPAMAAERAFTVKVAEVNRAPVLAPIADQQARAGAAMTVVAVASDPDIPENLLRFSVDGPAGMTVDDSGTLTWTPGDADVGPHQVTVRVLDDGAPRKQDERTFTVTVTAAGGGGGGGPAPAPGPSNGGDGGGGIPPLPGPGSGGGRTPRPTPQPPKPSPGPGGGVTPAPRPLTPVQAAARVMRFEPPAPNLPPVVDNRVTVTLSAPLKALTAVADLDVPVQLLSMGGAWTVMFISLAGVRRRRRRPFFVVDVPPGRVLRVLTAPNPAAELRFMLRPDAGPVWSRSLPRRRRGGRWVEVETPAGPGHVEARHLRDATPDLEG